MIGIIWVNHHVLVRSIKTVNRTLLFLNLVLLLFVVLIPFATTTVADYRLVNSPDARVSMALYGVVFLGMSVGFGGIFEWTLHGQRVYQPLPPEKHWQRGPGLSAVRWSTSSPSWSRCSTPSPRS